MALSELSGVLVGLRESMYFARKPNPRDALSSLRPSRTVSGIAPHFWLGGRKRKVYALDCIHSSFSHLFIESGIHIGVMYLSSNKITELTEYRLSF